ncbi:MAG: ribose-phosphate diphosphokinase, partial [Lysobacteraceae bacterium]
MSVNSDGMLVFSGNANRPLAQAVCRELGVRLGKALVGRFSDGEVQVEIEENVRKQDIFVIQSTCAPTAENFMELLVLIDALKRASAASVTAVVPYFGYARQDRKDEGRVPITAKLVANMIVAAGADRVLTIDLHA